MKPLANFVQDPGAAEKLALREMPFLERQLLAAFLDCVESVGLHVHRAEGRGRWLGPHGMLRTGASRRLVCNASYRYLRITRLWRSERYSPKTYRITVPLLE